MDIKKGDIVSRKSYNQDICFIVDRIIKYSSNKKIAIIKGINIRVMADSPIEDLVLLSKREIMNNIKALENNLENRIQNNKSKNTRINKGIYTGKILHLDGDRKYSEKSIRYYNKMGLRAIVKNIQESKQSKVVVPLLKRYNPDILIITGHDSMIKNGTNYNNIYNYRNSRHFINTVKEARTWGRNSKKLVIFAGACQSFYEGIISAGADFASSPGRILIDFIDPLIVAEKVALTEDYKFVSSYEITKEIREGERGLSGIGVMGKRRTIG